MKRQNKGRWMERWIVILRLSVVGRWNGKGWRMCNYYKKNVNVKTNYRKIGKKKDNDVDTDVTQLERSI